jgi:hypothetical protein
MTLSGTSERHPLCTCPPDTWDYVPDRQACRDRAPIDPHPVLDLEALRSLTAHTSMGR